MFNQRLDSLQKKIWQKYLTTKKEEKGGKGGGRRAERKEGKREGGKGGGEGGKKGDTLCWTNSLRGTRYQLSATRGSNPNFLARPSKKARLFDRFSRISWEERGREGGRGGRAWMRGEGEGRGGEGEESRVGIRSRGDGVEGRGEGVGGREGAGRRGGEAGGGGGPNSKVSTNYLCNHKLTRMA